MAHALRPKSRKSRRLHTLRLHPARRKLIEERALRQLQLALNIRDDGLRLIHAPLREQITNRLRHMQPQEKYIKRRKCPDEKRRLPPKNRNQQIGNARCRKPAKPPEALKQDNEAPAQARRCILAHQRRRNGQLSAQTESYEEAEYEQGFIAPSHSTQSR